MFSEIEFLIVCSCYLDLVLFIGVVPNVCTVKEQPFEPVELQQTL